MTARLACETPPSGVAATRARKTAATVPELTTERLRLRAPETADFDTFAEILCGPRGVHIGTYTRETAWLDFAQLVATWLLRGHGLWTVEPRDGGEPLGFVLLGFDQEDPEPELGYMFTARSEGRGIAFEAARAARDFAFDELGWTTLVSFVAEGNTRSAALAQRLGARADGKITDADGAMLVYRYGAGGSA